LDKIQFEDGRDKCTINRDDAAGFRLDTTFTHKQHKSVSSKSNPEMTTSSIKLLKGSRNDLAKNYQNRRPHLITFLSGTKKKKEELMKENPTLFEYFIKIWKLRDSHMVKGLPSYYIFQLLPCYKKECVLQKGQTPGGACLV
jgi:hypothetical protein